MKAQEFLDKYEQDSCKYCHKPYETLIESEEIFVYIDPEDGLTASIGEPLNIEFNQRIDFCPMCGRKL